MLVLFRVLTAALIVAVACRSADARQVPTATAPPSVSDVTLLRVFLKDGSSVVSYGEFARVGEEVVMTTPIGTPRIGLRLHLLTLPVSVIDWTRTDRYRASVRYQHYLATRAEDDFTDLTIDVARLLNEITQATDPARVRALTDQARRRLVEWPAAHYGFRADDVQEIVTLIDEAAGGTSASGPTSGAGSVQLSFIASSPPVPIEPLLGMPSEREQIERLVTLAPVMTHAADRLALLRAALGAVGEAAIEPDAAADLRRTLERQIRAETAADERYASLSTRLLSRAKAAANRADAPAVERTIADLEREDSRLGHARPDAVLAVRDALEKELTAARVLRQRTDQWLVRRKEYRDYADRVSAYVRQLTRARSALDAIRRLAGPAPGRVQDLGERLIGGADALQRLPVPEDVRPTHDLLVSAWRFAQTAAEVRQDAIGAGDAAAARRASSAAAASMMLLARARRELREVLEPPKRVE